MGVFRPYSPLLYSNCSMCPFLLEGVQQLLSLTNTCFKCFYPISQEQYRAIHLIVEEYVNLFSTTANFMQHKNN